VFHDKPRNKYWLADGWHRVKAAQKAGVVEIGCDVRKGAVRDAILFSLSANRTHGWNDTNSDKRRAVMFCVADTELQLLSARKIARLCKVSHQFVNNVHKEIAEEKAKKAAKVATVATPKKKGKEKQAPTVSVFDDNPEPESDVFMVPEGMELVDKHSWEETNENYKETLEQNITLQALVDSDEPLAKAAKEIHKLKAKLQHTEDRFNGLMNEKAEAIRHVKARDAVIKTKDALIKKQNEALKKLGAEEF